MSDPRILSLGSINADFHCQTDRPLEAGETLLAHDLRRRGGGKAANVAFLAHRLGLQAMLLGRVGDDDLAEQALAPLRRAGLDLSHVAVARHRATAVSMIAVPKDGKKSIVLAANANDGWDEDTIRSMLDVIRTVSSSALLVADFEADAGAVYRAMDAAHERHLRIVLDPAPATRAIFAVCHALTPDAREAAALTGVDTHGVEGAARAALSLAQSGPAIACVKLDDGGTVMAYGSGKLGHIPSVPVDVVDATGAGDAFTSALAVALAEGRDAPQAALFATAASHLAVTAYRSQESYPDRGTLDAFLPRLACHDIRL
jgi:ribokinase